MHLLTNGVEPAKSATPGNHAADPHLRLTITHWCYGGMAMPRSRLLKPEVHHQDTM